MPDITDLVPTKKEKLTPKTLGNLKVVSPGEYGWINLLVYGEPGVGKTRLAGSSVLVPEMCPVLLMDFEGGTLSLKGDMRDVDVVRTTSLQEIDNLYGVLYDTNPYKTVIVDSLSELQKTLMQGIMKEVVKRDSDRDPDVPGIREWGKNGEQVRAFVRAFRDLPCNTIFTALAEESKDERSGINKVRPALPGKLKAEVAGYVDIVLYMYTKDVPVTGSKTEREIKSLVLTQGTERMVAKDRSGQLPMVIESPTMQAISTDIKEGKRETESVPG
jgi:hypothetical protein